MPNRDDSTLELFDAQTLAHLATIGVAQHPDHVVVLPDSSEACSFPRPTPDRFPLWTCGGAVTAGKSVSGRSAGGQRFWKPDGGELYVTVPETHGIEIINTSTAEVAQSVPVGLAPT